MRKVVTRKATKRGILHFKTLKQRKKLEIETITVHFYKSKVKTTFRIH